MTPVQIYRHLVRQQDDIARALLKIERALVQLPHVVGYGVGYKEKGGRRRARLAAIILVTRKVARGKLKPHQRIPAWITVRGKRVPTDVVQIGRVRSSGNPAANRAARPENAPYKMGAAIGVNIRDTDDAKEGRGTAGALVHLTRDPTRHFLLSAGHVLVESGLDLLQPGADDGGLNRKPPAPPPSPPNPPQFNNVGTVAMIAAGGVDAGLAEINTKAQKEVIGLGAPTGKWSPIAGLPVQKSGAGSGITSSRIKLVKVKWTGKMTDWFADHCANIFTGDPPTMPMPGPDDATMEGIIVIEDPSFAAPGDSGSLIMAGPSAALDDFAKELLRDAPIDSALRNSLRNLGQRARLVQNAENKAVGLVIALATQNGTRCAVGQSLDVSLPALAVELD